MSAPATVGPRALRRAARIWVVGTGVALILVIAALIVASVSFQRRMVRDIEDDELTVMTQRRLVDWALAVHEAALAEEVVRIARSGDLKDAMAVGKRDRLLEQLEPPLNRLRKSSLAMSQLTLYAPDGRLLLHAHDPDDDHNPLFEARRLLATALGERRVVKGLEVVGGIPHVLAASPVYHEGKLIGVLEAGTSMAPILRSLQSVTGAHVGVRLGDGRLVEAASPELFTEALRRITPASEPSRHVAQNDQKPVVVTLVPLASFSGDQLGHLALLFDASRTIAMLERNNAVTFVIAFIGCAVAGALLFLLARRLDAVHARLEQLHATADEHRQRAERRAAGLAAVSVMTRSIASAQTPEEAAAAVATAATSVLGAALTRIWIEGPEPGMLRPAFEWGHASADPATGDLASIPAGGGIVGKVFASRTPDYRVDIQDDPALMNRRFVHEAGLHAYAGLPLVARGRLYGVMSLLFTERREFTAEEQELMIVLADSVAIALERSRVADPV